MNINLNSEQMTELVGKAIFDTMTPEARNDLLKQSITHLLTKPNSSYGSQRDNPLQEAFKSAAHMVAERYAAQQLSADPEFQANMQSLFADVAKKLFADEIRDKLVQNICDKIVSGLNARDY